MNSLFAATVAIALANTPSLGTGPLGIEFNPAEAGFGIRQIVNRMDGANATFVNPTGKGADFWEIEFHAKSADGKIEVAKIDNRAACAKRLETGDHSLTFHWQGLDLPDEKAVVDVAARVVLTPDGVSADWTIDVTNRSAKWALFVTRYPCLQNVVKDGEADAFLPWKQLGMRVKKNFVASEFEDLQCFNPWWRPSLVAFAKAGSGLLYFAYDGECRYKELMVTKGASLRYDTIVEDAGVLGKAVGSPKYPVRTTVFRGDWWEVARIYRAWALRQKWAQKGPIAKRTDFPKSLTDNAAFMVVNGGGGVSNIATKLRQRWPKAKIGFDWSQWQCVPFDSTYPDMLPALKGVEKAMDYGKSIGVLMKPYTNGRLWNKSTAAWSTYAIQAATKKENGEPYDEEYSKYHFGIMCPGAAAWRNIFVENERRVVDELHATALYIDQVSCSRAVPCFDPTHGHPLGGGTYWADGCREMLQRLHDQLAPMDVSISSEGAGEAYMGLIDGYDLASESHPEDVPFYIAVYGGYACYNGASVWNIENDFPAFFAVESRALLWGCVLETGWWYNWPLSTRTKAEAQMADAFAKLAEQRLAYRKFLVEGHLIGDVKFNEELKPLNFIWGTHYGPADRRYTATFPEVWGVVYADVDDTTQAVMIANVSDKEQTVTFDQPFKGSATLPPYSTTLVEKNK